MKSVLCVYKPFSSCCHHHTYVASDVCIDSCVCDDRMDYSFNVEPQEDYSYLAEMEMHEYNVVDQVHIEDHTRQSTKRFVS